MIDCNESSWTKPCVCAGSGLRWQNNTVKIYLSDAFTAEQKAAMRTVISYTESQTQCLKLIEVDHPTLSDIPVDWEMDDDQFLGSTQITFINEMMVGALLSLNLGHYDGTHSTLFTDIDDFATVFWHELLHALGIDDHAPPGSGNLMEATHTGEVVSLGDWDNMEIDSRYCDGDSSDEPLTLNSRVRFRCEIDGEICRLRLLHM